MKKEKQKKQRPGGGATPLLRGLTYDEQREQYRVRFKSRHTKPGATYSERLADGTKRSQAETYLIKLREDDRLGQLEWPSEKKQEPEQPNSSTFGEFCREHYIPHCEAHNRASTVARKKRTLKAVAPWFLDVPLDKIDKALVSKFTQERKGEKVRSRTVNIGIVTVQHALSVAYELGFLDHPPPKFQKLPEKDKKSMWWLNPQQIDAVLAAALDAGYVWYAFVLFLLHTGARFNEARNLRWEDVDLGGSLVRFSVAGTKGGKARSVPLMEEVVTVLGELPQESGWVFTVENWSRRKGEKGRKVDQIPDFSSSGRRRYPWDPKGLKVSPHIFRHTFAASRLRAGVSIAKVQAWLGHSSIQLTVDTYGHIHPEDHLDDIGRCYRPEVYTRSSEEEDEGEK